MKSIHIPRRTFLKGMGTAMALPFLEAMGPPARALAATTPKPPLRMAFLYVPNGANMADWTPARDGAEFELPPILGVAHPPNQPIPLHAIDRAHHRRIFNRHLAAQLCLGQAIRSP
jgi:hypothetical protein